MMLKNPDFITARDLLLSNVSPVEVVSLPLDRCAGRVLGKDLVAADDVPPFDRSPYDGYAFRAEDTLSASRETPVTLAVTEKIAAGQVASKPVTPGTAANVMTGAPIPPGANAVCMFEKTAFTDTSVTLFDVFRPGENVIYAGEDVKKGTVLARCGTVIDAGIAGTLAAQGEACPLVYRSVRVGIISTGNEVLEADEPLRPGMIRNSNRHMLDAAFRREGLEPVYLGLAGDDIARIADLIRQGVRDCNAVLLTGGVSVGDYDLTPAAMEACGCEILFRGVDLKPGMACAYGMLDGKPVCGLSGNPASSLTNYYAVALPALRKLAGRRDAVPEWITVKLKNGFSKKSPHTRILRGRLELTDGTVMMTLPGDQGNVVLSGSIGCDVMAVVPAGSGKLEAGTILKGFSV